jgi:hypothetical protein
VSNEKRAAEAASTGRSDTRSALAYRPPCASGAASSIYDKKAGAVTIFREKISGARADRPQLAKLMASLKGGDVIVVTKLDRLGRSTKELLNLLDQIDKTGAKFRSIGDPAWNTETPTGRLLSTLLAGIAEFERELIRSAQQLWDVRPNRSRGAGCPTPGRPVGLSPNHGSTLVAC